MNIPSEETKELTNEERVEIAEKLFGILSDTITLKESKEDSLSKI